VKRDWDESSSGSDTDEEELMRRKMRRRGIECDCEEEEEEENEETRAPRERIAPPPAENSGEMGVLEMAMLGLDGDEEPALHAPG